MTEGCISLSEALRDEPKYCPIKLRNPEKIMKMGTGPGPGDSATYRAKKNVKVAP